MRIRAYYAVAGIGFVLAGISSAGGAGPRWPNNITWAVVAFAASLTLFAHALLRRPELRRLATSAVIVASSARLIGWLATPGRTLIEQAGATGVFIVVPSLMLIVNEKARRT